MFTTCYQIIYKRDPIYQLISQSNFIYKALFMKGHSLMQTSDYFQRNLDIDSMVKMTNKSWSKK